jgi:ABC-type glycerol-3-phosphate transport system permease component
MKKVWKIVWALTLILVLLSIVFPVYMMFQFSISDRDSIITGGEYSPPFWPFHPTLEMYGTLLDDARMIDAALMSIIIALLTVVLTLIIGAPAAFGLARYKVPGGAVLLVAILGIRFFPDVASAVPILEMFTKIGLTKNVWGVMLTHTLVALPYVIFISMGVFEAIPKDLEEQAHVLGASKFYSFVHVVLPVAAPGLAASAIYTFLLSWNEFIFAYFLLWGGKDTLPVFLQRTLFETPPVNVLMTIAVLITIPVIIFTFATQKYMKMGMTAGSVK